ncbi:MAG: hypothetical protein PHV28_14610 [Kiritimatiellae bacterium]|nr:hypothetical protein [Kiritimatiellia bacterium]
MRCTMSILLTALVHIGSAAEYYVDPTGDDSNDGCAATPGALGVGPKKTLQGAMGITGLTSGDIVHAAAGDYDLGEAWASSSSNRVVVPAGVGLVATNAILTRIIGKKSEQNENGLGSDAVRCVYLNSGSYVRKFTITGGRTPTGTSVNGGGVLSSGGAAIDCLFTDNGCGNRGTAVNGGTYIRCTFRGNTLSGTKQAGLFAAYWTSYLIGCVFPKDGGDYAYGNGTILNCWLAGGSTWGTELSPVYNSYISADNGYKNYFNCVFGNTEAAIKTNSLYDKPTCVFAKDVSTLHIDAEYRPLMTEAVLLDKGSNANYEAAFPAAWLQFKDQDYAGGTRCVGEIDIGPGEFNWRNSISSSNGLDIVFADLGEGVVKVSVSRNCA